LNIGNDFSFRKGQITVEGILYEGKDTLYGLRLTEEVDYAVRTTDIVGASRKNMFEISVNHNYEALKRGKTNIPVKKPRIINDVIARIGGGADGNMLHVQSSPFLIKPDDLDFVAEMMLNNAHNTLPIVYLSRDSREFLAVNPMKLAFDLSGMSHVIVEPARDFSYRIRERSRGKNAYLGAIGIHWPTGDRELIMPDRMINLENRIYDRIRESALYTLLPDNLRFDSLRSMKIAKRMDEFKSNKTQDVSAYLELADAEITEKDKEINELKSRIHSLQHRSDRKGSYDSDLLRTEKIDEMYPGELRDLLIEAIQGYTNNVHKNSRREDMLRSVLSQNSSSGQRDTIVESLNNIFKGAPKTLSKSIQSDIRRLGFEVEHSGSHFRVYIRGQEGRKYTIACTASDHRSRKNELAGIKKYLL